MMNEKRKHKFSLVHEWAQTFEQKSLAHRVEESADAFKLCIMLVYLDHCLGVDRI